MSNDQDSARSTLFDEEKFKTYSEVNDEVSQNFLHSLSSLRRHKIRTLVAVSVLLTAPLIYLFFTRLATSHDQCGTTSTEARARGCTFETTGFSWLPKACLDPEIESEFLDRIVSDDLKFYRDVNYTQLVPLDEVRRGDGGFFVGQGYHRTHCGFLIKKLHRAWTLGKPIDGHLRNFHHTAHCVDQLLQGDEYHKHALQYTYTKFPYCGKAGGYNLEWPKQGTWISKYDH